MKCQYDQCKEMSDGKVSCKAESRAFPTGSTGERVRAKEDCGFKSKAIVHRPDNLPVPGFLCAADVNTVVWTMYYLVSLVTDQSPRATAGMATKTVKAFG